MIISSSRALKSINGIKAFIIPFLLHGFFDSFLMSGGYYTYLIGPMLVIMIFIMEYMLAKAQTLPPPEWLEAMELQFEEWATIQREPQYERWITRSMGLQNTEFVPFFQWNPGKEKIAVIIVMLLIGVLFFPLREFIFNTLQLNLKSEEEITLFVVLPVTFGLNLVIVGTINPLFFRQSMIKIPIIVDVDFKVGETASRAITYDITLTNCLLKTIETIKTGKIVNIVFTCSDFQSPELEGEVIWDNHINPKQASGTVIRILTTTWEYRLFLLKYYTFKLARGLLYNLKLPGFEGLRKLFVRPASVMQKQKNFSAGTILFKEGDVGKQFYLIHKGEVEIFKTLHTDERVTMTTLGPGDIFGEMAIVGDQTRAASSECKTDCILAVADGDDLDALITSNPEFAHKIIQIFARRLHTSEQIMSENISELEYTLENKEQILFSGLVMLLLGLNQKVENKRITVNVNMDAILNNLNVDKGTIFSILQLLMNTDDSVKYDEEELNRFLTEKVMKACDNYRIIIQELGIGDPDSLNRF